MIRTLDASMIGLRNSIAELAPLAARFGFQAVSAPGAMLDDEHAAREADIIMEDNGLQWGLLGLPADFYHWDLDDKAFETALEKLARRAEVAEKIGVTHAYNHVWPCGPREFNENFDWHVKRVRAVSSLLRDHGVQYGLEFLGPHELRTWQKYQFVHSLAGVLAIADAADGIAGIAFDTYHWFCSSNALPDDLLLMSQHTDRLVAMHLNDGVAGVPFDQQKDMERRLPMETGVIDSRAAFAALNAKPNNALYMIEPFQPACTRFREMPLEDAVREAAEWFVCVEK